MSFITGTHLPRRMFLRGVGATVALPFLDAMVPARKALAAETTASLEQTRLVAIEIPALPSVGVPVRGKRGQRRRHHLPGYECAVLVGTISS